MGTYRQRRGAGGEGAGEGGAAATSLAAASLVITAAELSPPLHPRWGSLGGALGAPPAPLCLSIYQVGAWGGKCGGEVWGEGGRCGGRPPRSALPEHVPSKHSLTITQSSLLESVCFIPS